MTALSYRGICAGGIIAGHTKYNSFDFTEGIHFDFNAAVNQGTHKTVVSVTGKDGPTLDQYWEDGPQFTGWGQVVGRYPDDYAAVVQGSYGKGWLVLVGFHPDAPESWRKGMSFRTSARTGHEYAYQLIQSALEKAPLPF